MASLLLILLIHYVNIYLMYKVIYKPDAIKTLARMPRNVADKIRKKVAELSLSPFATRNNVTALSGGMGYRLRVGDWRIIYTINDDKLEILMVRIAPRGEMYKK